MLFAQGGVTGGWSLYLWDGAPVYHYNFANLEQYEIAAEAAVPAGEHQLRAEFAYDGGGIGKGGAVTLYVDGAEAGAGRVERTCAFVFSLDETCAVGSDSGAPVCDGSPAGTANAFTGEIAFVQIDLGDDSHDHRRPRDQDAPRDDQAVGGLRHPPDGVASRGGLVARTAEVPGPPEG